MKCWQCGVSRGGRLHLKSGPSGVLPVGCASLAPTQSFQALRRLFLSLAAGDSEQGWRSRSRPLPPGRAAGCCTTKMTCKIRFKNDNRACSDLRRPAFAGRLPRATAKRSRGARRRAIVLLSHFDGGADSALKMRAGSGRPQAGRGLGQSHDYPSCLHTHFCFVHGRGLRRPVPAEDPHRQTQDGRDEGGHRPDFGAGQPSSGARSRHDDRGQFRLFFDPEDQSGELLRPDPAARSGAGAIRPRDAAAARQDQGGHRQGLSDVLGRGPGSIRRLSRSRRRLPAGGRSSTFWPPFSPKPRPRRRRWRPRTPTPAWSNNRGC